MQEVKLFVYVVFIALLSLCGIFAINSGIKIKNLEQQVSSLEKQLQESEAKSERLLDSALKLASGDSWINGD